MKLSLWNAAFAGNEPSDAHHTEPQSVAAQVVFRMLGRIAAGSLTVTLPNGRTQCFGTGTPHAAIVLHNWTVCAAALRSGDIGFGESYMAGDWSSPDLPALLELLLINRSLLKSLVYGSGWSKLVHHLRHLLHRNSRRGSRRNIHAHYDLGNDFYRLWLDESMTYSSALFTDGEEDLARAQQAKYRKVLEQLQLPRNAGVLEIGCGWGGFAEAAGQDGLRVTGLTLSAEQLAWARALLARVGLAGQTDLRFQDYRDADGQYDGIVSIEMFEAVGEQWWPAYFACIKRNLKPGGRAVVQTITIADELFADYRKGSDFIQQYVFPGGMLPSKTVFAQAAQRAGLQVQSSFAFGRDYARTLLMWLETFTAREREVCAQGFDETFLRTWRFYLAYCAAAFSQGNTDVVQFTLEHRA